MSWLDYANWFEQTKEMAERENWADGEERNTVPTRLAARLVEEVDDLAREVRRMQLFVEECWEADEFLHPTNNPFEEQEAHWNERGWEYDGFGSWAPPGYHVVRPGKIQRSDY